MSSVVISGNTSGSVTLAAPDVAGTTTLTLPATSGTVALNGPAFSVQMNATQSISNATVTLVAFNTKTGSSLVYDTANCFDTSTYKYTPNVAGYYQFSARIAGPSSDTGITYIYIIKNNVDTNIGLNTAFRNSVSGTTISTSGILYMNGTTDYVYVYCYQNTGGTATLGSTGFGYANFQGCLIRAA